MPRIQHAVVDVAMREYGFEYKRPVPAGRVVFRVVNAGRQVHRLTMLELPDDLPPIAEQLRGRQRRNVTPFAGLPGLRPGETNSFAVDLVRGRRYGLIDPTGEVDGKSNAVLGLNTEFRAGGGRPGPKAGVGERKRPARNRAQARRPKRKTPRARRPSRPRRRVAPEADLNPSNPANPANAGVDGQEVRP